MEDSIETPATDQVPVESTPVVRAASGRPAHTLASIFLMAVISIGALYGVAWSYQVEEIPVLSWDFRTLNPEDSPWIIPSIGYEHRADGAVYLNVETSPGPELKMDIDTQTVTKLRATMEVTRVETGEPVKFSLEWYWSSKEDVAAANGGWPYSGDRGMAFRLLDRHQPMVHTAPLTTHSDWQGEITRGFIGVKLPKNDFGPYQVRVIKLEFLE